MWFQAFFQEQESRGDIVRDEATGKIVQTLAARFVVDLRNICSWFHHGFFAKVNVYDSPFDFDAGYKLLEKGGVRVLLYRFASFDKMSDAMASFVNIPGLRLERENASRDKSYGDLLDTIRRSICLPSAVLDALYATPYAAHFLTQAERERAAVQYGS